MKEIEFTTTSANHIANLAKEFIVNKESGLSNIKLTSTTVSLISGDSKHIVEYETPHIKFSQIEDDLQIISEATSFAALWSKTKAFNISDSFFDKSAIAFSKSTLHSADIASLDNRDCLMLFFINATSSAGTGALPSTLCRKFIRLPFIL